MVLSELQWVVQIDQLPYGHRLGVDVGLDLQIATTPALPTDCGIIVHLENLPVAHEFEVAMSLDADSRLDPERRRNELEGAMQALADYLVAHPTISSIRGAYRAGDLKSAFIHRDVRSILEASDDMPTGAST